MADFPTDPNAFVAQFIEVFHTNDSDALIEYFTPDGVWHNMPMAPAVGRDEIYGLLQAFVAQGVLVTGVDVKHQIANGNVVINERVDHVSIGDQTMSVPVCGVFVLENGLIKEWRDYFDGMLMQSAAGA